MRVLIHASSNQARLENGLDTLKRVFIDKMLGSSSNPTFTSTASLLFSFPSAIAEDGTQHQEFQFSNPYSYPLH